MSLTLCAYLFVLSILCFIALYMPPLVSLMTFGLIAAAFPPAFSRATTGPSPSCELHLQASLTLSVDAPSDARDAHDAERVD